MTNREFAALDEYQLLPRVLHSVMHTELSTVALGRPLPGPMVPRLKRAGVSLGTLAVIDVDTALRLDNKHPAADTIALLGPARMDELIDSAGQLAMRDVAAVGLDFAPLGATPPFGQLEWRPRSREELAELRAAAGCPLWLFGILSVADAEVAAEAGVDGVVVGGELGRHLGAPTTIDLLPEVIDAVAGMLTIVAGGPSRNGVDVLRYLAVGAELVVVDGDRSLPALTAELDYAMRLIGCASISDIGYDALFAPLFGEP